MYLKVHRHCEGKTFADHFLGPVVSLIVGPFEESREFESDVVVLRDPQDTKEENDQSFRGRLICVNSGPEQKRLFTNAEMFVLNEHGQTIERIHNKEKVFTHK